MFEIDQVLYAETSDQNAGGKRTLLKDFKSYTLELRTILFPPTSKILTKI